MVVAAPRWFVTVSAMVTAPEGDVKPHVKSLFRDTPDAGKGDYERVPVELRVMAIRCGRVPLPARHLSDSPSCPHSWLWVAPRSIGKPEWSMNHCLERMQSHRVVGEPPANASATLVAELGN